MVQEAGVITVAKVGLAQPPSAIAPMSSKVSFPTNMTPMRELRLFDCGDHISHVFCRLGEQFRQSLRRS